MSMSNADNWENELNDIFSSSTIVGLQEANLLSSANVVQPPSTEREAKRRRLLGQPVQGVMRRWELVGSACNSAALLVSEVLLPIVTWRSDMSPEFTQSTCSTGLAAGDSGVVSCYFSQCARPDFEFYDCLAECRRLCVCIYVAVVLTIIEE